MCCSSLTQFRFFFCIVAIYIFKLNYYETVFIKDIDDIMFGELVRSTRLSSIKWKQIFFLDFFYTINFVNLFK